MPKIKVVRILANEVVEVIPEYALPVEKWYGVDFARQCVEAPDEVDQRWRYINGAFKPPLTHPTRQEKIDALKKELGDTDYKAIKFAEGQITEGEYAPVRIQRQIWRNEINVLEAQDDDE